MPNGFNLFTRRNFLKSTGLVAVSLPLVSWGEDKTPIQRLEELLELNIVKKEWEPIDVTKKVREALGGRDWEFQRALGPYPHDYWTVQYSFKVGDDEVLLSKEDFGTHFLCRNEPRRVYTLDWGDEKGQRGVGFPMYYIHGDNTEVAENGVVTYSLEGNPNTTTDKVVVANINTGKKLIFSEIGNPPSHDLSNEFGLSGIGNRFLISRGSNYFVFNTSDNSIVDFSEEEGAFLITHEGKSILHHQDYKYYARNVDTKEMIFLTDQNLSKVGWKISKNGMYWGCLRSMYPAFDIEVCVFGESESDRKNFIINHPVKNDYLGRIDDDGTIHARSGQYAYRDGMYHWATKGEEPPSNLEIRRDRSIYPNNE